MSCNFPSIFASFGTIYLRVHAGIATVGVGFSQAFPTASRSSSSLFSVPDAAVQLHVAIHVIVLPVSFAFLCPSSNNFLPYVGVATSDVGFTDSYHKASHCSSSIYCESHVGVNTADVAMLVVDSPAPSLMSSRDSVTTYGFLLSQPESHIILANVWYVL